MIDPLFDRILVLELHQEQMMDGILLPETSREDTKYGTVIAVGGEVKYLKKDDVISFGLYAGVSAVVQGITFLLMKEGEALFKVVPDE